jgi:xanthine dehydrogenase accessory factor
MIPAAMWRRAEELAAQGQGFVTATVVRVQHPTSVQPGSVALVLADGTIEGFVGGVCAEASVRAYSLVALRNGEPVLLRILPDAERGVDEDADPAALAEEISSEDGAVTVQNPCLSGGAIEVFLEPTLPAPRVLVVGDTPIARALHSVGGELGLEMVTAGGTGPDPAPGDLAVVVAAHGRNELHALRRGLEAQLPYVALVASPRRGAGVLDELRADGIEAALLSRIEVPAGIAIGARTPGEIAVSILARIVAVRRAADPAAVPPADPAAAVTAQRPRPAAEGATAVLAVDPVCGMTVAAVAGTPSLRHAGKTVYFCCERCRDAFAADHEHAVAAD